MATVKRGKALVASLRAQAGVRDPEALAAYLGRFKKARKAGKSVAAAQSAAKGHASSNGTSKKTPAKPSGGKIIPPTAHAAHGDVLEPGKIQSAAPARKMRYKGNDFDMRNVPSAEVASPQNFVIDHPHGRDRFVVKSGVREPPPPSEIMETYPRSHDQSKFDFHKGALEGSYDPQQKKLTVSRYGNSSETPDKATLRKLKDLYPLATKVVFNGDPYKLPPRKRKK